MKKLLLAGVAVASIAAFAPATAEQAQQPGSANQAAQQQSNNQETNAAQPNQAEVKQAQQALGQKGFKVHADGIMGPQTKQALTQFQQKQGLQQSGQLDQQTMAALGISQSGQGSSSTTGQGGSSTTGANPQPQQPSSQQPSSGMSK